MERNDFMRNDTWYNLKPLYGLMGDIGAQFNEIADTTSNKVKLMATDVLYNPNWNKQLKDESFLSTFFLEQKELNSQTLIAILDGFP